MSILTIQDITGAILAGGRARRMGGTDKGLVTFHESPMVKHVIDRLKPQVASLLINANRNIPKYETFGYPVITDQLADYQGPLSGMASVLSSVSTSAVVFVPCDAPLLPSDFVTRLLTVMNNTSSDIVCAHNGDRIQPAHALVKRDLLPSLLTYLDNGGRKIDAWYTPHNWKFADFSDVPQAFVNVNSKEELDYLQQSTTTS